MGFPTTTSVLGDDANYTPDKVSDVMHQANRFGINAFNYVHLGRAPKDLARFQAEGGRMHLIVQCIADAETVYKAVKPLAMYKQGEEVDKAFQNGEMDDVKEWCKKARDLGVAVGVGTHKSEVIAYVEEQGWDVDFYAGCVYNRTRTPEEWKQVLHGESLEMAQEIYLRSDPPRMYKVMRQTKKPCFAFKILAAGRLSEQQLDAGFPDRLRKHQADRRRFRRDLPANQGRDPGQRGAAQPCPETRLAS